MIEKKITPGIPDDNSDNNQNKGIFYKLQQSHEDANNPEVNKDIAPEENIFQDGDGWISLAKLLIDILGDNGIIRIKKDAGLMIPFTDGNTDTLSWTAQCLKMLFKPEELAEMQKSAEQWEEKNRKESEHLREKLAELENLIASLKEETKSAEDRYVIAESDRLQARKEMLGAVPAEWLIDQYFPKNSSEDELLISTKLKEELHNPAKGFVPFLLSFLEGWAELKPLFDNATDDESGMRQVFAGLSSLLEKISGHSVSQRRPILEVIASLCSSKFKSYQFVSPEESLQVDPRIHSATALGGSTISEGVTFAVVRSDTKQTIIYAEIKVQ